MKIAIMQPYFFPYLGYFQLINAVDKFVFYDDVNFIKNGWINRNRIIINNATKYLTVQLNGASPFKLINEIEFTDNRAKLKKTLQMAYRKSPMYDNCWPLIEDCFNYKTNKISDLAIYSIKKTTEYLKINTHFEISSKKYAKTRGIDRTQRLKSICNENNANIYINPIGGQELYKKEDFLKEQINLFFIKSEIPIYQQFSMPFIPGLSIIDVMMFNQVEKIHEMLNEYKLI